MSAGELETGLEHLRASDPVDAEQARPAQRGRFVGDAERRLLQAVLNQALDESVIADADVYGPARAWLLDEPGFTARECCEALGVDYEALCAVMRRRWEAKS